MPIFAVYAGNFYEKFFKYDMSIFFKKFIKKHFQNFFFIIFINFRRDKELSWSIEKMKIS